MKISKESSNCLNALKCILAIGVVFLHTRFFSIDFGNGDLMVNTAFSPFKHIMKSVEIVFQLCVPVFFCISGYLFFLNCNKDEADNFNYYSRKYKTRMRTLLIPYLIGNVLVMIAFYIAEPLLGGVLSGDTKSIHDFTIVELLKSFWIRPGNNGPFNEVLWFIRDLMVMVLLAPLFKFLIRKFDCALPVILGIWYLLDTSIPIPGLRPVAFFFFSMGAFFSIKQYDIVKLFRQYSIISGSLYLLAFVASYYTESLSFTNLSVILGTPMMFGLTSRLVNKFRLVIDAKWVTATFFTYIYHDYLIIACKKLLFKMIMPTNSIECLFIYLFTAICVCLLLLFVYKISNKLFPKAMSYVVGGR